MLFPHLMRPRMQPAWFPKRDCEAAGSPLNSPTLVEKLQPTLTKSQDKLLDFFSFGKTVASLPHFPAGIWNGDSCFSSFIPSKLILAQRWNACVKSDRLVTLLRT